VKGLTSGPQDALAARLKWEVKDERAERRSPDRRANGLGDGRSELLEHREAGVIGSEHLGVPLKTDHEACPAILQRLDHPVGRAGGNPQAGCHGFHGLMVQGIDGRLGTEEPVKQRARLN